MPKEIKAAKPEESEERTPPEIMTDSTNPRRDNLAEIAENRRRVLEAELNEDKTEDDPTRVDLSTRDYDETDVLADPDPDAPGEPKPEGEPEPEPEPAAGPEPKAEPEPEPAVAAAAQEPTVTVTLEDGSQRQVPLSSVSASVKINGRDQTIDGQGLVTGYQKSGAADQRFEEASELVREARKIRETGAPQPAPDAQAEPTTVGPRQPTVTREPEDLPDEVAGEIAQAIQYGSEDDSRTAVKKLFSLAQEQGQTHVAGQDVTGAITDRVMQEVRHQMRYSRDIGTVAGEYPGIFKNEGLLDRAKGYTHAARGLQLERLGHDMAGKSLDDVTVLYAQEQQTGRVLSDVELFRVACQATEDWAKGIAQLYGGTGEEPLPVKKPKPVDREKRIERKRVETAKQPVGATAFQRDEPAPPPKKPSDVVQDMKKARGQI